MPWTTKSASSKTKRASTPKLRRQWADVANSALSRGASESSAIRQASGVVKRASFKRSSPGRR